MKALTPSATWKTNSRGEDNVQLFLAGTYSVIVEMTACSRAVLKGIKLVGQTARVDVVLQVGHAAAQEVIVTEEGPLVKILPWWGK